jgi:hypothetical protein
MLYVSCDYREDPKVPPTKFTITVLGKKKPIRVIKVAEFPSLAHAFTEIGKTVKELTGRFEAMTSSSIDYLFSDGLLSESDFAKEYKTPEINSYKKEAENDILKLEFKVDPCRGFAAQAVSAVPEGYSFLKMERKGTKALVYYTKD